MAVNLYYQLLFGKATKWPIAILQGFFAARNPAEIKGAVFKYPILPPDSQNRQMSYAETVLLCDKSMTVLHFRF